MTAALSLLKTAALFIIVDEWCEDGAAATGGGANFGARRADANHQRVGEIARPAGRRERYGEIAADVMADASLLFKGFLNMGTAAELYRDCGSLCHK